jgi:hypothetical protein
MRYLGLFGKRERELIACRVVDLVWPEPMKAFRRADLSLDLIPPLTGQRAAMNDALDNMIEVGWIEHHARKRGYLVTSRRFWIRVLQVGIPPEGKP